MMVLSAVWAVREKVQKNSAQQEYFCNVNIDIDIEQQSECAQINIDIEQQQALKSDPQKSPNSLLQ
jgi:hypothetical protein